MTNAKQLLRQILTMRRVSIAEIAKYSDMTANAFANKLNNKSEMSVRSLLGMCRALNCKLIIQDTRPGSDAVWEIEELPDDGLNK